MISRVDSAAVVRPMFGHAVSGDAAFVVKVDGGVLGVVVDVLGHGKDASELTVVIEHYILEHASGDIVDLLSRLQEKFHNSRGAAIGLCVIKTATGFIRYVGIGNTVIRRFGPTETRLVSRDGMVGGAIRTPVVQTLQLADSDIVVMYTDGVQAHFKATDYPRLQSDTPQAIAANIVDRFGKSHDDASCVAMRYLR